jgi:hypothetical protein
MIDLKLSQFHLSIVQNLNEVYLMLMAPIKIVL